MTDAQTILKMIEEVDPSDTAKLDEIDLRVCAYVTGWRVIEGGWIGKTGAGDMQEPPQYTRSRDALKAIRPEGWNFEMRSHDDGVYYECWRLNDDGYVCQYQPSHTSKTEELAELHCIIKAISHERGNQ